MIFEMKSSKLRMNMNLEGIEILNTNLTVIEYKNMHFDMNFAVK